MKIKQNMIPYNNPTIVEAILDIKTSLPPDILLSHLQEFQEFVKADYPLKKERRSFEGGVEKIRTTFIEFQKYLYEEVAV